jgi:protein TonB
MKKNRVFFGMIGLSIALHGFVFLLGQEAITPTPSEPENQFVTKIKLIKMTKAPPQSVPVQQQKQKVVEKKPDEAPPEYVSQQGTETIAEAQKGNENMARETGDGESKTITGSEYSETEDNREYEELLAYISSLIRQNLLYPQMARRRNIEGIVGVYFELGTNGGLLSVRVHHSSGSSILDRAAVSLIEKICPIRNSAIRKDMALHVNITYELTE